MPRQQVAYQSNQSPGTIIVDTKNRYLYYILGNNQAMRYSIAVGVEGYGFRGTTTVSHEARMAGLESDAGRAQALPRSADAYGGRTG